MMQAGFRDKYEALFESSGDAPLYNAPWWLDAACGKNGWHILPSMADASFEAYLPIFKTKIRGLQAVINPPLTQWLTPLARDPDNAVNLTEFLGQLSGCAILDISLNPERELKELSSRYRINFRYSYIMPATINEAEIRKKYNEGLKRNLREAAEKYTVQPYDDIGTLIELYTGSYSLRGGKPPYEIIKNLPGIYNALLAHGRGELLFAFYKRKPVAGIMIAWDQQTAYYITGGRSSSEEGASAHALLLDHAILHAHTAGRAFDFEGSMHPGIANFFQSFGAVPKAYYQVRRYRGLGKVWALFKN